MQVDYMPMGHDETGWKNEVGAHVYSSRTSKIVKAYPVKDASTDSAIQTLKMYCKTIIPRLKEKVDCLQTDAGTQFNTDQWREACLEHNITHRTCPVDHQAMNGQVERVIGILAAKVRALLMGKGVEHKYWPLALDAAAYLLNRTPHQSLNGMSPLQAGTGHKPDLSRLRVFGCKAYVQVPKVQRTGKLSNTAWTGVMMGYSTQSPEWMILDPRSGRLRNAYSATFNERKSGFTPANQENSKGIAIREWEIPELTWKEPPGSYVYGNEKGMINGTGNHHNDKLPDNELVNKTVVPDGNENQQNNCLRRSTRARRRFNPSHMPSGTLEMKMLNDRIENDSSSNESEELELPANRNECANDVNTATEMKNEKMIVNENSNESESIDNTDMLTDINVNEMHEPITISLGTCMALTTNNVNLPSSWRQAINIPRGKRRWKRR